VPEGRGQASGITAVTAHWGGAFWAATAAAAFLASSVVFLRGRLAGEQATGAERAAENARLSQELAQTKAKRAETEAALAAARSEKAAEQRRADVFAAALDALPSPVWVRGDDLSLIWRNQAQRRIAGGTATELRDLSPGGGLRMLAELARSDKKSQTLRLWLAVAGERRHFHVCEAPATTAAGETAAVGWAEDLTPLEILRNDLERHLSANAEVLERVGSAIAMYGADTRMTFFNRAYVDLWGLSEDWLRTRPSHGEVLEELHSRRSLPEYADFPSFKRERLERYRRLMEPTEELMHLPDGKTLRALSAPHPLGGVVQVLDDVTDRLELLSSYNTLTAVMHDILGQLAEGVAVFGGDGRLKFHNAAFAGLWEVDEADLADQPHITRVFERLRPLLDDGGDWEGLKEDIIGATLERAIRSGRLERADGRVVEFSIEPLPDGSALNLHHDVTDEVRAEESLRAAGAALTAAEQLRSAFMSTASLYLRAPLSEIVGFTEVLADEYFGRLNPRQADYAEGLRAAAERALRMLDNMMDLSSAGVGEEALELKETDAGRLISTLAAMTREWARRDAVDLTVDAPADLGSFIADEKRLWQALFSIIIAAIHSPPQSRALRLAAERRGGLIIISVGPPAAFEPDALPPGIFSEPRGSLALSTALARNLINLHGGRLEVEEMPGEGPVIRCVLPVDGPAPSSK
jgi:signal transduction histidine kinase